ncbi:MAG: hypothetical protein R3234_03375, partial [Thermoanaerobaculia bacterium]|nr:hypothetical protein [Thermoanaerobaculia bacterium]
MTEVAAFHEEEELGKAYDSRLMARLLGYVRPYKGRMVLAVVLIVVSSILQLVGPLATAVALDLFVDPLGPDGTDSAVSLWVADRLQARGVELGPAEGLAWTGG